MDLLCLNLGCGSADEAMPGFVNLDRDPRCGDGSGWMFESGLPGFESGSVDGITISHVLMYVRVRDWMPFLAEAHRVLRPGGVIRVTEDVTDNSESRHWTGHSPRYRSWDSRVTPTSGILVVVALRLAGFTAREVSENETDFIDGRLCQSRHNDIRPGDYLGECQGPHVFFAEGVK